MPGESTEVLVEILVVFVVLCVLASPVALIAMIASSSGRKRELERLDHDVGELRLAIVEVRGRIGVLETRGPLASMALATGEAAGPYRERAAAFPPPAKPAPEPRRPEPIEEPKAVAKPVAPRPDPMPAAEPIVEAPAETRIEWERWIGVRGAAALGAVVLVIAGLFFFKYSIDSGILTPELRVLLGAAAGLGAIAFAQIRVRSRHAVLSNWLTGAGVAILYTSIWASRSLYELVPTELAFALMIGVTAACTVLSIRNASAAIALLGLLGGFATPIALSSGGDHPIALFGYLLVLDVALLFVAVRQRWVRLGALSLMATTAYEALWIAGRMHRSEVGIGIAVLVVFAALFAMLPSVLLKRAESEEQEDDRAASLMARAAVVLPMGFGLWFAAGDEILPNLGALALFLGVLSIGALLVAKKTQRSDVALAAVAISAASMAVRIGLHPVAVIDACVPAVAFAVLFHIGWEIDRASARALPAAVASTMAAAGLVVFARIARAPEDSTAVLVALVVLFMLALRQAHRAQAPMIAAVASLVYGAAFIVVRPLEPWSIALAMIGFGWAFVAPKAMRDDAMTWRASAVALALVGIAFAFIGAEWHLHRGVVPLGVAIAAALSISFAKPSAGDHAPIARGWFAVIGAVAATVALAFTFQGPVLTSLLAIEGLAVCTLSRRIESDAARYAGGALLAAATYRLLGDQSVLTAYERSGTPIVNWLLPTYLVPAAAMAMAFAILRVNGQRSGVAKAAGGMATVLVFAWMNLAVIDAFETGRWLTIDIARLPARDLTMSIAWAVFALALLGLGMRGKSASLRWTSLGLVLVTALKVFLFDLAYLQDLYRVASLVGLAASLIVISALYQRFVLGSRNAPEATVGS